MHISIKNNENTVNEEINSIPTTINQNIEEKKIEEEIKKNDLTN